MTLFYSHWILALHYFQGNIRPQSVTLSEVPFFTSDIGRLTKKEEQIDELLEKAQDLLWQSERPESIAAAAISTGAPDADAAALAAEEASYAAFGNKQERKG